MSWLAALQYYCCCRSMPHQSVSEIHSCIQMKACALCVLVAFVQIQLCITRLAGAVTESEKIYKGKDWLNILCC